MGYAAGHSYETCAIKNPLIVAIKGYSYTIEVNYNLSNKEMRKSFEASPYCKRVTGPDKIRRLDGLIERSKRIGIASVTIEFCRFEGGWSGLEFVLPAIDKAGYRPIGNEEFLALLRVVKKQKGGDIDVRIVAINAKWERECFHDVFGLPYGKPFNKIFSLCLRLTEDKMIAAYPGLLNFLDFGNDSVYGGHEEGWGDLFPIIKK